MSGPINPDAEGMLDVVVVLLLTAGLTLILAISMCGCGGSGQVPAETARVAACQAVEARIEDSCQPDCGPEDHARVDCVRLVCDELHERIVVEEE